MSQIKLYRWQGVDIKGRHCSGYQLCSGRDQAELSLLAEGTVPYILKHVSYYSLRTWHRQTVIVFFQQLASMLNAGLTLTSSLELLMNSQLSRPWQILIELLIKKVTSGEKLSKALSQWPQIFSPTVSALISTGELTGHLPKSCLHVVHLLEQQQVIQEELMTALRYPCLTLFFLLITTNGLLIFILPEFALMYQSLNTPLPLFTQWLLQTSDFLHTAMPLLFLSISLLILVFHQLETRHPHWKITRHRLFLNIPLFGKIWQCHHLALLFSTLSTTQQSGLTLLNGLHLVVDVFTSPLWKTHTEEIYQQLHSGKKLSQAMAYYEEYPAFSLLLIRSAEETGQLEHALAQLATWYSHQATLFSRQLAQRLEPLMLGVSGGLVGSVVIAMYLPIFYLGEALG